MAERLKAHAWKACVRESVPWVRIPLPPPTHYYINDLEVIKFREAMAHPIGMTDEVLKEAVHKVLNGKDWHDLEGPQSTRPAAAQIVFLHQSRSKTLESAFSLLDKGLPRLCRILRPLQNISRIRGEYHCCLQRAVQGGAHDALAHPLY